MQTLHFWFWLAPRWALKETFNIRHWSWSTIVFSAVAGMVGLLYQYRTSGVSLVVATLYDWLAFGVYGAGVAFIVVFIINLLRAPAHLLHDLRIESSVELAGLKNSVTRVEKALEERPTAQMYLVEDRDQWWIEVEAHNADAEFVALLDFAETTYRGFGRDPSHAQWSTKVSTDLSKMIPRGCRARFFLYGVPFERGFYQTEFRYIRDGLVKRGKGHYAWSPVSEPVGMTHESDKGVLKVILTATPPLRSGSMVARLAFDGHSVTVIEGEVQIRQ